MKIHFNKDFWRDGFFYIYLLLLFLWIAPFSDGSVPCLQLCLIKTEKRLQQQCSEPFMHSTNYSILDDDSKVPGEYPVQ